MSETVHYRGVATKIKQPNNKSLIEVAKEILKGYSIEKIPDHHDSAVEYLCDIYYKEFFYYPKTQSLYKLNNSEYDSDKEIIVAKEKNNTIEYELRYYNGGAEFDECLEEAFDKLHYK